MTGAWTPAVALRAGLADGGTVTLVDGSTFCLCLSSGDVQAGRPHGLFMSDTRVLSGWRLEVDGESVEPLIAITGEPYQADFVGRMPPRGRVADSTLLILRHRLLGDGMHERVVVRNLGPEAAGAIVTLAVEADFADLFEVKESRLRQRPAPAIHVERNSLRYTMSTTTDTFSMQVSATGDPVITPGLLAFRVVVPARGEWSTEISVRAQVGDQPSEATKEDQPDQRLRAWRVATPVVASEDTTFVRTLRTSAADLGALQIYDPRHPDRRVVAAGAPWFMALFGRDSLLTSWMALPLDQRLALSTLQTLADHQGQKVDALTEEQPGRILHEVRLGREVRIALGGGRIYYGTIDATPLFVALLGELHRWGLRAADLAPLLPAADRALAWITKYGDLDGDGFVEYRRATDRGLINQGWKDSFDGINDEAGRPALPPIALAEVQGYVYAAYLARAAIAADTGDDATAMDFRRRAAELKWAFNEHFWLPDLGWYAIALDGEKRPVDSLASNMGHCLWTGIVDEPRAADVARHLVSPPMWTGFGIRTLASSMGAYNPISYHNGSVWPHDTAIAVAGLMRYGFVEQAQLVATGLLDAAAHFGGRLPELFCGFDRAEFPVPVPYPTSCSPQAWASAAPVMLMRALLRLDPDVPEGRLGLDPALPERLLPFSIDQLRLAEARLRISVERDAWKIDGLPAGMTVG